MADEQVFHPETIEDQPFPQEGLSDLNVTDASKEETFSPSTIKDKPLPKKVIAFDLIGVAMNTKSKKILQEFQFTQSGALQVGKYENGVSGDLRISPNGITARNISGLTTFAIDGNDGSAVFAGTLQSGATIVADSIVMERASNGNGRIVLLNEGVPAILIGDPE